MDLEWDVIKVPVGLMPRCPNTFVHWVFSNPKNPVPISNSGNHQGTAGIHSIRWEPFIITGIVVSTAIKRRLHFYQSSA